MARRTYRVTYQRDAAGFWVAEIESVKGCYAQGRSLRRAKKKIREVLAFLTSDARAERANLDEVTLLPRADQRLLDKLAGLQEKLARLQDQADDERRRAVRALAKERYSLRDLSELLGISHQRVAQILGG